jgi:hypothetical protein
MIYACCDENRRAAIIGNPTLNGIDYLEVMDHAETDDSLRQRTLLLYCLKPAPATLSVDNVLILGGESVTNVTTLWIAPALSPPPASSPPPQASASEIAYLATLPNQGNILVIRTNVAGDFSPYTLRLVNDATQAAQDPFDVTEALAGFDPQLAEVTFSFKVECGPDFDCKPVAPPCALTPPPPPPINYLAKDYGSFRTVLLDRLAQLLPSWEGASEADIGVVLAELVAYVADQLSYKQDAVTTEAYLLTARSRISLRRHALLVDYRVSDGCNARVFMHIRVSAPVLLNRKKAFFYTFAPGMPVQLQGNEQAALDAGVVFFEPIQDAELRPEHNEMQFYAWGDENCCLPQGATEATLLGAYPHLAPGDLLVFQEVMGPQTGFPADADIRHRCVVRLTAVATTDGQGNPLVDPLFEQGTGKPITSAAQKPTPVTEIQWAAEDALPFPLCISSKYLESTDTEKKLSGVSAVFGNVVLADQGLTMPAVALPPVPEPILFQPPSTIDRCNPTLPAPLPPFHRPTLPTGPLTQAVALALVGAPTTSAPVPLNAQGYVGLTDANGYTCLMARATNPSSWPQYFGVTAAANQNTPGNFDVSVVYNPNSLSEIVIERFTNLTLAATGSGENAIAQINALSQLIQARAVQPPVATNPTSFPTNAAPFAGTGAIELEDGGGTPYLSVQPKNLSAWPPQFGLLAQGDLQDPTQFNLLLVYQPVSGGVGVQAPIVVEEFDALSLATISSTGGPLSKFFMVLSFEQAPNPGVSATALMIYDARAAAPAITLAADGATWTPAPDLLAAGALDPNFVVEVESDGLAHLRFGDNQYGHRPVAGTVFTANFRIGNGTAGNVGADSLIRFAADPAVISCTNPLPASSGVDPETNEQIRRRAPQAFMTQERAVTVADYAAVIRGASALIEDAAAELRWTGSWSTAFIAAEPRSGGDLSPSLRRSLARTVNRYHLAGQDIKIESPDYIPLEIELRICVDPNYFQSDVRDAVKNVLCAGDPASGRAALFAPGSFELGQTVYLSPIYAAARSVAGVRTVVASVFQPQGVGATNVYLQKGEIAFGPFQAARLDNDPSLPNHGRLTLDMTGGK